MKRKTTKRTTIRGDSVRATRPQPSTRSRKPKPRHQEVVTGQNVVVPLLCAEDAAYIWEHAVFIEEVRFPLNRERLVAIWDAVDAIASGHAVVVRSLLIVAGRK